MKFTNEQTEILTRAFKLGYQVTATRNLLEKYQIKITNNQLNVKKTSVKPVDSGIYEYTYQVTLPTGKCYNRVDGETLFCFLKQDMEQNYAD